MRSRWWRGPAALLLSTLIALSLGVGQSPAASTPAAGHAPAAPTPTTPAELAMIPPPASATTRDGAWQPSADMRILIADESLAAEGARLQRDLVELGLVETEPELAVLADADLATEPSLATEHDVVLELSDDIAIRADADEPLTLTGPDAEAVFRASRPLLQQLVASAEMPAGDYEFAFEPEQTRAAHIDIARKHYPIETLEALVGQLSWFGFNELELHFSENEGFAIESTSHPDIASPDAHTQDEIRDLIELANDQHIRVVPSLDMPGHLDHALENSPELRLRDASGGEVFGALDITSTEGQTFANDLIDEYAELFAQPDFDDPVPWNLGADEFVNFADGHEVATLTEAAQSQYGAEATAYDALTNFVNIAAHRLDDHGYQPRVWSDGMLRSSVVELDPDVQVAHWTTRPPGAVPASEFAAQGYELINVNDEFLYFVLGERVGYTYPTGEAILDGWNDTVFASTAGGPDLVDASAGGMLAIWGDIPDALTAEEVVERVHAPLAAMAVKFAEPDASMPFDELTSILAEIGDAPAPAPLDEPDALPTIAPSETPAPTYENDDAAPGFVPPWFLIAVGTIAVVALAFAGVTLARRRRTRDR